MIFVLILTAMEAISVAFNNGANDVMNAFTSAVGRKALKTKHALAFTIFVTWLMAVPVSAFFIILIYFTLGAFMLPLV
jgi:phosphate/sulfate permease